MSAVLRPASWMEAAHLLGQAGPGARPLAGGTDTLTRIRAGSEPPATWIDLTRIGGAAREILVQDGQVTLGALVSFRAIADSEEVARSLPALWQAASVMGSRQIRARGTIGGNLCNASPAGDAIPHLIVGAAQARLLSPRGERWLPVEQLFLGPGSTCLQPDELLTTLRYPVVDGARSAYRRLGARAQHVISKVSAALACRLEQGRLHDVRFALGAVAPIPLRAPGVEAVLEGQRPEPEVLTRAGEAAAQSASPIDDVRSTAVYRRRMCARLVGMLVEEIS